MERVFIQNEKNNTKVAKKILNRIRLQDTNIILLYGNLGAGKTTITREIANTLDTINRVSSPTFVIQKVYNLNKNSYGFVKIFHIDLYRLTSKNEVKDMGLFENRENQTLYIVEWPEKVENYFKNPVKVKIISKENGRLFKII